MPCHGQYKKQRIFSKSCSSKTVFLIRHLMLRKVDVESDPGNIHLAEVDNCKVNRSRQYDQVEQRCQFGQNPRAVIAVPVKPNCSETNVRISIGRITKVTKIKLAKNCYSLLVYYYQSN